MREEKQKWLRLDGDDGWQIVIPEVDIKPHSTDTHPTKRELAELNCPCKPKIDVLNKIIVHNSFEDAERIDKAMNNPMPLKSKRRV